MENYREKECRWKEKFGVIEDILWHEEGIALYRKWLPYLDGEERLRIKLALSNLLLDSGWEQKIVYENYRKARGLFLEIMEDSVYEASIRGRAAYHLGYIARMLEREQDAIPYFQIALEKFELSVANQIKAHYQLTACFHSTGNLMQAQENLRLGRELDHKREFQNEYENARMLLNNQSNPYLYFQSNASERAQMTMVEADEVITNMEDIEQPLIILDWRNPLSPQLLSESADGALQIWEAKLIRALVEKNQSANELADLLGELGQLDAVNVKSKVSRLRESLRCREIAGDCIKFIGEAYSWVGMPIHVILHKVLV